MELHCPDSSNQISQLLSINSKTINEVTTDVNKDSSIKKPTQLADFQQAPNFNYKKLPEIVKLDKTLNNFQLNNRKDFPTTNLVKSWPSILNLDQNGYPITNWNEYSSYLNSLNNQQNPINNQINNQANNQANNQVNNQVNNQANNQQTNKDLNSLFWQMMDSNQQQKNFFDTLTNNIQQQQFLQSLFNKQQLTNWLDKSNKNAAALSYLNYLNSKQPDQLAQDQTVKFNKQANDQIKLINSKPINLLNKNKTENIVTSSIERIIETKTTTSPSISNINIKASNLNRAEHSVSYDFKQPFIKYNGKEDFYSDENEQDNSAVISLVLSLSILILFIVVVGFRLRKFKRKTLTHEASDYVINGLYL